MAQKQLATKIDAEIKDSLDKVLDRLGIKLGRFIESAILDKLEEIEDLSDLYNRRSESNRSLDQVIEGLKKSGKL